MVPNMTCQIPQYASSDTDNDEEGHPDPDVRQNSDLPLTSSEIVSHLPDISSQTLSSQIGERFPQRR